MKVISLAVSRSYQVLSWRVGTMDSDTCRQCERVNLFQAKKELQESDIKVRGSVLQTHLSVAVLYKTHSD